MYCEYSREASEMFCVKKRGEHPEIKLCWNIEASMKECDYFSPVSKEKWIEIQNKSDRD